MSVESTQNADLPKNNDLPTPSELPDADLVIYDGHCRFCTAGVRRLHRLDGKGRLAFLSLHDPSVATRFPDLTHQQLMDQMYVVTKGGQRYGGAAAARYLSRRLPRLWPIAPWMHVPFSLPLWSWGYRQIAKRRYRWGKTDSCDGGACDIHFR